MRGVGFDELGIQGPDFGSGIWGFGFGNLRVSRSRFIFTPLGFKDPIEVQ